MTLSVIAIAWPLSLGIVAVVFYFVFRPKREITEKTVTPKGDKDSGFFQAVLAQYLALDALHWSHVNTLTAIQGATLAGAYALWADHQWQLAVVLINLGFGLTFALHLVIERTKQVRDVNNPLLKAIGLNLDPNWELNPHHSVVHHRRPVRARGDHVVMFAVLCFLLTDLALLFFVLAVARPAC